VTTVEAAERRELLTVIRHALRREAEMLAVRPELTWQQLHNRVQWAGSVAADVLDRERQRQPSGRTWFWLQSPPTEPLALMGVLGNTDSAFAFTPDGSMLIVMRNGLLQQVASPQELYERPANLFVAGFIGSPAMNFMGGTLEEGKLRTGLGDIPLTGRLQQALSSSAAGRQMIVGIRPEDFEDASLVPSEARHNGITFPATVDVVESLGSEKYVYFSQELGGVDAAELTELPGTPAGRTPAIAARPWWPGSTRPPGSPRGTAPRSG